MEAAGTESSGTAAEGSSRGTEGGPRRQEAHERLWDISSLQISYQPGGFGEKRTLLENLEEPAEAATATDALVALRKWIRWRQRTEAIHAMEPDPTVLMKGLSRLVHRALEKHHDLQFRVSLARSSLLVDSTPTKETVTRYASRPLKAAKDLSKIKRRSRKTRRGLERETERSRRSRKMATSRSEAHGACPTSGDTAPRSKQFEESGDPGSGAVTADRDADASSESSHHAGSMKHLLEEATQMLKSMSFLNRLDQGPAAKPSLDDLQRISNEDLPAHQDGPRGYA